MSINATSSEVICADKVEGTPVYNTSGQRLGAIDDLVIHKRSGQVRYAVLEFGGFLGIGTDRYPLPWTMLKYDTDLDGYVVPLDEDRLKDAPRYSRSEEPPFLRDAEYGRHVNTYYGY